VVCVDLVGPYSIKTVEGKAKLSCLTILDPATNWIEIVQIHEKTASNIARMFDRAWLCRYPRPEECIFDKGKEFTGLEFTEMLESYGISEAPAFNLDSQSISTKDPWGEYLDHVAWALRSTIHTTLKATPAQLVFGRDMVLPISFEADWEAMRAAKQKQIHEDNIKENKKRIRHEYKPGDEILVLDPITKKRKLARPTEGPFVVIRTWYCNQNIAKKSLST